MMIPEAWENHEEMDPARRRSTSSTPPSWSRGTARRSWRSPTAPRSARCSTATACAPPATGSPRTAPSCWPPRSACSTWSRRRGAQGPPRTGPHVPGRHRGRTRRGREEIKSALAAEHPYEDWLHAGLLHLRDLPEREREVYKHDTLVRALQAFGYTEEELTVLLRPMAASGAEPIGSMGNDAPIAAISERPPAAVRLLHPAVRADHQPAAGRDPRGARHGADQPARAGAEPAGGLARQLSHDRAALPPS